MRMAGVPHDAPATPSTASYIRRIVLPGALSLLPPAMDSREARVIVLAIGFQESDFEARRQHGDGPARGFWQFERGGGVRGVLEHPATRAAAASLLDTLNYSSEDVYAALEHNDLLACAFARLLLWTHPAPMPADGPAAWAYYLATWRPGKPRPDEWAANFHDATLLEAMA